MVRLRSENEIALWAKSRAQLLANFDPWRHTSAHMPWGAATEAIRKYGVMIKSPSGNPVQLPYVSVANRQAEIMMR
jgi:hypothetical protein